MSVFGVAGRHVDRLCSVLRYSMNIEGETWFLKPMNCPGHCMIFDQKVVLVAAIPSFRHIIIVSGPLL